MKNSDFMLELDRFGCLPGTVELSDGKYDNDWCVFYVEDIPYFIAWCETYNLISQELYGTKHVFTSMVISKIIPGNEIYIEFYCGNQKVFRIPVEKYKLI